MGRHSQNNQFALLVDNKNNNNIIPTPATDSPVLDHESGVTQEHQQLCRHPKYMDTWDTSYADEIGHLCQGIGEHPTLPNQQQVTGTEKMWPIIFSNIPRERITNVVHTKVVCEV